MHVGCMHSCSQARAPHTPRLGGITTGAETAANVPLTRT